jgi:hypothetical protein
MPTASHTVRSRYVELKNQIIEAISGLLNATDA